MMMVDVREYPEFAAGHIEGSRLVPLGRLAAESEAWDKDLAVSLVCRSGRRADQARAQLEAKGFTRLTVLEGGVERWQAMGRPLVVETRRPWSLERQVRIVAGSLVLVTLLLALGVSRYFLIGTGLVGGGLIFAGVSDICMMASVLGRMPWNRVAGGAA